MDDAKVQELAALFESIGKAHHKAFEATDGADPEWPSWYAEHLKSRLSELLGASFTKSELVYLIVSAEKEQALRAPGAHWPRYYAKLFLERYA